MTAEREMTLDEWCAKLPNSHRANKELAELKAAALSTPQARPDGGEGDDEAARRYIRDWCPDHVKDYIDRHTHPAPAPDVALVEAARRFLAHFDDDRDVHEDDLGPQQRNCNELREALTTAQPESRHASK